MDAERGTEREREGVKWQEPPFDTTLHVQCSDCAVAFLPRARACVLCVCNGVGRKEEGKKLGGVPRSCNVIYSSPLAVDPPSSWISWAPRAIPNTSQRSTPLHFLLPLTPSPKIYQAATRRTPLREINKNINYLLPFSRLGSACQLSPADSLQHEEEWRRLVDPFVVAG